MQGNPVSKNETKKLKLNYMYKKLIEQHTRNKAGLLWCTPFILTSKRQRQVALLELEPSCVEKTLYQITKMYTCWNKRIKKKKKNEKGKKERQKIERKWRNKRTKEGSAGGLVGGWEGSPGLVTSSAMSAVTPAPHSSGAVKGLRIKWHFLLFSV